MSKPFHQISERLLRGGVAPRHVRRYVAELAEHLADLTAEEERAGRNRADAESAAIARLGNTDDLASAMIEQRRFQSWCARAPWVMFGLAPLLLLAGAWFLALFILWSGWNIFLPGAETPFVRISGPAILYFGVGRMIYFGAPVFVGWGIMLLAARQRLRAIWPIIGLNLIAFLGIMGQVQVHPPTVPGGVRHVGMSLATARLFQIGPFGLVHALVILSLALLPYLVWRLRNAASLRITG